MKINQKKYIKAIALALTMVFLVSVFTACIKIPIPRPGKDPVPEGPAPTTTEGQIPFDDFVSEIFRHYATSDSISLNFLLVHPEDFGIDKMEPTYGEYDEEYFRKEEDYVFEKYLELMGYDYSSLDYEQQLVFDLLNNDFSETMDFSNYMYHGDILSPTVGFQANLPFIFSEYHINVKEDFDDYIKLLELLPGYFDKILAFEKIKKEQGTFMAKKSAEDVIAQIRKFTETPEDNMLLETFSAKLDAFEGLTDAEKTDYTNRNHTAVIESVIPAFNNLATGMEELNADNTRTGGLATIPGGAEYYELLVASETGSEKSVEMIEDVMMNTFNDQINTFRELYANNPAGAEAIENVQYPETEPRAILEFLRSAMTRDFPEITDDTFEVKEVHKSMEEFSSPAFYFSPPIDDPTHNSIYINNSSLSDDETLFTTLAHEGYPGHLYQIVSYKNLKRDPIRSLLNYSGYTEGWAKYVEGYAYEYAGLEKDLAEIKSGGDAADLCLYALIDIGVNYYAWTLEDTAEFLAQINITDQEVIEEIFNSMVAEPANYLKYSVGCVEFIELKELCKTEQGADFDLKEFHRFIIETGPAPFGIITDRMYSWIDGNQKRQAA